jgi:hypothetical protein
MSSLDPAESSLGVAKSSLGDAMSSLDPAESSLGVAKSSLGDAMSSLSNAKSLLGDATSIAKWLSGPKRTFRELNGGRRGDGLAWAAGWWGTRRRKRRREARTRAPCGAWTTTPWATSCARAPTTVPPSFGAATARYAPRATRYSGPPPPPRVVFELACTTPSSRCHHWDTSPVGPTDTSILFLLSNTVASSEPCD